MSNWLVFKNIQVWIRNWGYSLDLFVLGMKSYPGGILLESVNKFYLGLDIRSTNGIFLKLIKS